MRIHEIITESREENFKRWFGNSKVVDGSGKPLVVYHGYTKDATSSFRGPVFLAYIEALANSYAGGVGSKVVPLYASISNPLILRSPDDVVRTWNESGAKASKIFFGGNDSQVGRFISWVKSLGHDGVFVEPSALEYSNDVDEDVYELANDIWGDPQIIAFYPNQIKSATGNNGEFNPNNPDITKE